MSSSACIRMREVYNHTEAFVVEWLDSPERYIFFVSGYENGDQDARLGCLPIIIHIYIGKLGLTGSTSLNILPARWIEL